MTLQAEPLQVGLALVVQGNVRAESTNGISRVIEPNSQIFLLPCKAEIYTWKSVIQMQHLIETIVDRKLLGSIQVPVMNMVSLMIQNVSSSQVNNWSIFLKIITSKSKYKILPCVGMLGLKK